MSTILLLGKEGQVGWELARWLTPLGDIVALGRGELDLAQPDRIREAVRGLRPGLVVNAAAYTAVDRAEAEPQVAMAVNGLAPGILADEARRAGAALVHYSTDYVFDGLKGAPYAEEDVPNPLNVYGQTKLAGENAIRDVGGGYLILRTSWVYGTRRESFLTRIVQQAREKEEIRVVQDQVGSPTWCGMVARATAEILKRIAATIAHRSWQEAIGEVSGLYHYAGWGSTSWFHLAREILVADPHRRDHVVRRVNAIASSEYRSPALRPCFSALAIDRVSRVFGLKKTAWQGHVQLCWAAASRRV